MLREKEGFRLMKFHVPINIVQMSPEKVVELMKDCLVVEAKYDFAMAAMEYTAAHPDFEICPQGTMAKIIGIKKNYEALEMEVDGKKQIEMILQSLKFEYPGVKEPINDQTPASGT